MKTRNLNLYALALATGFVLILSGCSKDENIASEKNSSPVILKAGNGPSANGHGAFYYSEDNLHRIFSFHAQTKSNGSVQGSGTLVIISELGFEDLIKFNIDCLQLEADNVAAMSGYVTSDTYEPWPVGTAVVFRVIDNGSGANSDPDQMTLLYQALLYEGETLIRDWDCTTFPEQEELPYEIYDIEEGNIQVNP